ncbi:type IIL restriction-modification enzyme MmeI [Leadbetterella sp. DM7]|uniref:type IIL restriction-modification enzyme MmeI n=1 Tax=Leadbetterella sp. DM7 TaxID=3235085 RepID=UPI00349EF1A9
MGNPFPLKANSNKSFQGSIILGKGFVLTTEEAQRLLNKDPRNKDVLFPYLNGDDLNNDPEQKPSRWVINFFDWSEEKARTYHDCFKILEERVKPERQRWKLDKNGNEIVGTYALRRPLPQKWWIYGEKRPALYNTISKLDQVMVMNRYTKYLAIDFQPQNVVFSDSIIAFALDSFHHFSIFSSSIHEIWAWKNSSTMGSSTLRYSPTNAFETFPLQIHLDEESKDIGIELNKLRKSVMTKFCIGFTELYNLFHEIGYNKDDELKDAILKLRYIHCMLDRAILKQYEWEDIELNHDFYEMEYLPENDRIRYTIHPYARKEILNRLLQLNHKLHKTEIELQPISMNKLKVNKSTQVIDLFSKE